MAKHPHNLENFNAINLERVRIAESIAGIYAQHPDVWAILLGGSTARGTAGRHSDLDLGIFWTAIPASAERQALVRRLGGELTRTVDNSRRYPVDNPRRDGCLEMVELTTGNASQPIWLDLEHETVEGTRRVFSQVVKEGDISLEKQELLHVIQNGISLTGHDFIDAWRRKQLAYSDELAVKMVSHHFIGFGTRLVSQLRWVSTGDWFCLYEGFLRAGRSLLLTLMGLNREWAYTDNPNFKGMRDVVNGFEIQPNQFVPRLGRLFQSRPEAAVAGFVDLSREVLELIETHLPQIDLDGKREMLQKAENQAAHPR